MADTELLEFIRYHVAKKTPRSEVDQLLAGTGWSKKEIDEAIAKLTPHPVVPSVSPDSSPKKLPGIGELLSGTFHILKTHAATIYGVIAISNLSVFLPYITLKIAQASLGISSIAGPLDIFLSQKETAHSLLVIYLPLLAVFTIIAPVMQILGTLALYHAVIGSGDNIGILDSYRRGIRHFFAYLWVLILLIFVALGGFALFVIPGIIVTVWTSNALFVLTAENIRGTDALVKSRQYVTGHWWSLAGRLLMLGIVQVILYGALSAPFAFLQILVKSEILTVAAGYITTTALTPLPIVYGYLLYERLKNLKTWEPLEKTGRKFLWLGFVGFLVVLLLVAAMVSIGVLSKPHLGNQIQKYQHAVRRTDMKQIENAKGLQP